MRHYDVRRSSDYMEGLRQSIMKRASDAKEKVQKLSSQQAALGQLCLTVEQVSLNASNTYTDYKRSFIYPADARASLLLLNQRLAVQYGDWFLLSSTNQLHGKEMEHPQIRR